VLDLLLWLLSTSPFLSAVCVFFDLCRHLLPSSSRDSFYCMNCCLDDGAYSRKEWEHAAHGGLSVHNKFPWGNEFSPDKKWHLSISLNL
jgi:hypothetical protein